MSRFKNSLGIIAVGTASQEGDRIDEESRARDRADTIISALRVSELADGKNLYRLNLGQYKQKKKLDKVQTGYQRRLILIGIMEKPKNISEQDLEEKLKTAIKSSEGLQFDTDVYSRYEFKIK